MTAHDFAALSPLLALFGGSAVVMLAAAFRRRHGFVAALALAMLVAALAALAVAWPEAPRQVTPLLMIDRIALFYVGLVVAAAIVVVLLARAYFERDGRDAGSDTGGAPKPVERREEFYILLLLATAGAAVLSASAHFASFFLGLELLSVSIFALVAYQRTRAPGVEAGVKYLILAGMSSAFLLFGMALVYAERGALDLASLAATPDPARPYGVLMAAGVGLMLVAIGFKLSLVPFHMWAPDVYQGAPAPVTAFVATVSKGAVFAVLLRFAALMDIPRHGALAAVLSLIAIASMFAGNWLALLQTNVKRMLAYSSIAHMGYLLVAFLASGGWAPVAVTCYLTAYFLTTLGAFGVVSVLSTPGRDADAPDDYRGLAWRRPWLAGVFTAMLLSLAGIPLTAGFIGKFYVLAAGVNSRLWLLVVALVVNSAIGLFYYLRTVVNMYRPTAGEQSGAAGAREHAPGRARATPAERLALAALTLALLWIGVYPSPLIRLVQSLLAN